MTLTKTAALAATLLFASLPAMAEETATSSAKAAADMLWTGFYAGASLGQGMTNLDFSGSITGPLGGGLFADFPDLGGQGGSFAFEVGYTAMLTDKMAWGMQLEHGVTSIKNDTRFSFNVPGFVGPLGNAVPTFDLDYEYTPVSMTSLLGRIGILSSERTMIYGVGGVTRTKFRGSYSAQAFGLGAVADSYDVDLTGATIGAGVETLLTDAISFKLDYRVSSLDALNVIDQDTFGARVKADLASAVQIVNAGIAWRF